MKPVDIRRLVRVFARQKVKTAAVNAAAWENLPGSLPHTQFNYRLTDAPNCPIMRIVHLDRFHDGL
jgi:hypothetical protein